MAKKKNKYVFKKKSWIKIFYYLAVFCAKFPGLPCIRSPAFYYLVLWQFQFFLVLDFLFFFSCFMLTPAISCLRSSRLSYAKFFIPLLLYFLLTLALVLACLLSILALLLPCTMPTLAF